MEDFLTTPDLNVLIQDARPVKEFIGVSFSGFKKTAVHKALLDSLIQFRMEASCYWSAELICAGHAASIWETLITFFIRHIHTSNIKLAVYLHEQIHAFQRLIVDETGPLPPLSLRNNNKIRVLFGQIMCVLTESKQGRLFKEVKVNVQDLHLPTLLECPESAASYFLAPNTSYAEAIYSDDNDDDPREVFVAINELAYAITPEGSNWSQGCYWAEWIISYIGVRNGRQCTAPPLHAARRIWSTDNQSLQSELIWLVWSVCLDEAVQRSGIIERVVASAHFLFAYNFKRGDVKKRRGLLYFAIGVLTEPISSDVDIIKNKEKLLTLDSMLDHVYAQIQQNEITVLPRSMCGPWA